MENTKINSTKGAVKCILLLWEKLLVVRFFKQKWGLEHQCVALKEVCGDKYVQEYTMYVVTNSSVCVRGRDGGGIKRLLFFLPNT